MDRRLQSRSQSLSILTIKTCKMFLYGPLKPTKVGFCPLVEIVLPTPMNRRPHSRHAMHVGDINSLGVTFYLPSCLDRRSQTVKAVVVF